MPFESPRMMPGQEPYSEEEYRQVRALLGAALDEEETGGYPVGSRAWMDNEILRDIERDLRRLEDDPSRFHPIERERLYATLTADRARIMAQIEGRKR